jgi:subfamily B ATP-binding cassette protein MsbA
LISPEILRILRELKGHKRSLIVIALSGLFMAAADTKSAMMIKEIGDGLQQGNANLIKESALLILLLAFVKGVSRFIHLYKMNYTGELVTQGLRQKLQAKFMNLNLTFHNTYRSGSGGLISRVLNDLVVIQHGLRMFADFFREPWLLLGLISWLFYLNWRLTALIFIVLPCILIFLRWLSKGIKKYSIKGQEDLEKITSTIKETLDGVRTIQSFNLESEMRERFERESDEFLTSRRRIHRLVEASGPITEFVMTAVILSILLYISLDIASGKSSFGDFMSYLASLLMLSAPVKKMQESYVRIQETAVAAKRAFELLDDPREVQQPLKAAPFPSQWSEIKYDNVSFRYGDEWVLRNVSFTVKRGEKIGLVGESGSGKSTLVNLLERFFDPTEGHIFIDGVDISQIDLGDLRRHIALVSQDVFLFSDTIEKNIQFGDRDKSKASLQAATQSANAHGFIQKMPQAYQYRVGERGSLLSGGERQRVGIARAFFKDSPILILDEATSALDSSSEIEVQKGLESLMQGRTAFVIAHRLSTLSGSDRIFVFKTGQLIEQGSHDQLLKNQGEYHRLYTLQNNRRGSTGQ